MNLVLIIDYCRISRLGGVPITSTINRNGLKRKTLTKYVCDNLVIVVNLLRLWYQLYVLDTISKGVPPLARSLAR
jgi:hypothetical protein